MTRKELCKEIKRIDGCIEILHGLITMPLCQCIPHLGDFDEKFREKNQLHLEHLMSIKDELTLLADKPDDVLNKIQHQPVCCY